MNQAQQMMADVHRQILDEDYYVSLYGEVLKSMGLEAGKVARGEYPAETIVSLANKFWMALPDHRAIRRPPFMALCDVAELMFEDDEPEPM